MFSPLNDPQVEHWFQRLNAPLKRLPAAERQALHEEVRQHLDALAKANEELGSSPEEAWKHSLRQFGDPTRIGRRMAWEWRREQGLVGPQFAAILWGIGVAAIASPAAMLINWLASSVTYFVMNIILIHDLIDGHTWLFMWTPIIVGLVVGRKHPHWALAGVFYAALAWPILPGLALLLVMLQPCLISPVQIDWPNFMFMCFPFPVWLLLTCGAAYLASVTKRGWYKPTLDDFKLTLPKRRRISG